MGWISRITNKQWELPLSGTLKDRLSFGRRRLGNEERDELLVKIDILTSKNNELLQIAEIDPAQSENQLSDEEAMILKCVARENVESEREIADELDINLARAKYRMARLLQKGYLVDYVTLNYHAYVLDRRGRDYLVDKGLHQFNIH
jgi:ATP/maltotriose-dependent transcriptional regulator MalT